MQEDCNNKTGHHKQIISRRRTQLRTRRAQQISCVLKQADKLNGQRHVFGNMYSIFCHIVKDITITEISITSYRDIIFRPYWPPFTRNIVFYSLDEIADSQQHVSGQELHDSFRSTDRHTNTTRRQARFFLSGRHTGMQFIY